MIKDFWAETISVVNWSRLVSLSFRLLLDTTITLSYVSSWNVRMKWSVMKNRKLQTTIYRIRMVLIVNSSSFCIEFFISSLFVRSKVQIQSLLVQIMIFCSQLSALETQLSYRFNSVLTLTSLQQKLISLTSIWSNCNNFLFTF